MAEEREKEVFVTQRNSRKRLSDRVTSIDIAKGIAILLVIIGHCNHFFDYNSETKVLIYGFHMPLFVILSGCTLRISEKSRVETLSWIAQVKKKTLTILVPYFFCWFYIHIDIWQNRRCICFFHITNWRSGNNGYEL